jgi:hypothetical protein
VSDARWIKIEKAVASSVENFAKGVEFTRHPGFQSDDLIDSAPRMGFMHAIQAGHTSLENALLRMLDLMDEARPSGDTNRRCQCPPGHHNVVMQTQSLPQAKAGVGIHVFPCWHHRIRGWRAPGLRRGTLRPP